MNRFVLLSLLLLIPVGSFSQKKPSKLIPDSAAGAYVGSQTLSLPSDAENLLRSLGKPIPPPLEVHYELMYLVHSNYKIQVIEEGYEDNPPATYTCFYRKSKKQHWVCNTDPNTRPEWSLSFVKDGETGEYVAILRGVDTEHPDVEMKLRKDEELTRRVQQDGYVK